MTPDLLPAESAIGHVHSGGEASRRGTRQADLLPRDHAQQAILARRCWGREAASTISAPQR